MNYFNRIGPSRGGDESQAVPSSPHRFLPPQFHPHQHAQSLAFFHLVWSRRLDSRSPTDKSLCCSRCNQLPCARQSKP